MISAHYLKASKVDKASRQSEYTRVTEKSVSSPSNTANQKKKTNNDKQNDETLFDTHDKSCFSAVHSRRKNTSNVEYDSSSEEYFSDEEYDPDDEWLVRPCDARTAGGRLWRTRRLWRPCRLQNSEKSCVLIGARKSENTGEAATQQPTSRSRRSRRFRRMGRRHVRRMDGPTTVSWSKRVC